MGLADLRDRKPGQLSGGQQQRVAIARALAHEPQIVVADEPTGNLDLATGDAILDLLLNINQQTGTTFVISTHSTQLKARAGRVVEIRDGGLAHDSAK
ncbi:putative ABC transporter ATP-binding protein [compost metagenome]